MMRAAMMVMVVLLFAATAGAGAPSAHEVMQRVLNANADTPDVTSADVVFSLRVKKPITDAPDCQFDGTMRFQGGRQSLRVGRRTSGFLCWAVDKYVLGKLFEASEPMQNFLDRFDFTVLGEKLVGTDHFYLVRGSARDAKNNPRSMLGWVDFERGLIVDGRIEYTWGTVDAEQAYSRMNGAWVVTRQVIRSSRFDATIEVQYSNFRFAP